ncbi:MarR family transcriptional regulator [Paenibacillus sp. N1-5-1-14]|uniref:MarR family winged helix-turn-helix transcriptional regulator n=1 Tax=Paenibacillus radicibacter TaxID=2972488 RepID=UPI002158D807|nr:MarR family transcriptional regulator [Paenibacillus radicibacter]MCR8644091.1 MarR family transcriptional regulator [Paenibacillus radicibacter]
MVEKKKDLALDLFIVLSRAFNSVAAHTTRDIRESGLNVTEFGVLELLWHKGALPLQQIGEKVLMSSGNITYVVDKLEAKGLLVRKPCPEDRRVTFAEISDKGSEMMEQRFPKHEDVIRHATAGLDAEEKQQIIKLLKKLGISAQKTF